MSGSPSLPRRFSRSPHAESASRHSHHRSTSSSQTPVLLREPEHRRVLSATVSASRNFRGFRRFEARRTTDEAHYLNSKARAQNWNPPVDLRLLDYITECDSNLICPICRCPFVDPVVLPECDHCFCRECIQQTWSTTYIPTGTRGTCPACRTPAQVGPKSTTSKILVNIVDDLLVKCPRSEEGCKAELKRGEVQDHCSIYCGYTRVECPSAYCESPVLRKDSVHGCLHYGVSCLSCHKEMQRSTLETHWISGCPDREVRCGLCKQNVFSRELVEHSKQTCPAISIPCPGQAFGCTSRNRLDQAKLHAKSCTLAKLAPILSAQKQRMDEQEVAQISMARKLEVLENGFSTMHAILHPEENDIDATSADESRIPFLQDDGSALSEAASGALAAAQQINSTTSVSTSQTSASTHAQAVSGPFSQPAPAPFGPRPADLPEPFTTDFDLASPFPPPVTNGGPYASPLHHLLSMHESLRDEMTRINTALQELDGRHSMQILNENLRMREEISYLGAQTAGLSRQLHWLTSSQLQGQQSRRATSSAAPSGEMGDAGPGVDAAVSAVTTATSVLRGAARMVNPGQGVRRGVSEEGRTKL